jgi:hypothetical protein
VHELLVYVLAGEALVYGDGALSDADVSSSGEAGDEEASDPVRFSSSLEVDGEGDDGSWHERRRSRSARSGGS